MLLILVRHFWSANDWIPPQSPCSRKLTGTSFPPECCLARVVRYANPTLDAFELTA